MTMRKTCLLLLAGLALGGAAPQSDDKSNSCFWPSQVTGFSDGGPNRAYLRIAMREVWEVSLAQSCPNVDWALKIGIRARAGDRICSGRPAVLVIPETSGTGIRECQISALRKLSPDEAAKVLGESPKS